MKFREFLSTADSIDVALDEICAQAEESFSDGPPDFAVIFQSSHPNSALEKASARIRSAFGVKKQIGCTAESTIGAGKEIERQTSLAVGLARLPGVVTETFHLTCEMPFDGAPNYIGQPTGLKPDAKNPGLILLGDPFSFPAHHYLATCNEKYPGIPVVGGLASGGRAAGENRVLIDGDVHTNGAVGIFFSGDLVLRAVVSQGCRPFGRHYVITEMNGPTIQKLGGQPAFQCMHEAFSELGGRGRELFQTAPLLGHAISEMKDSLGRGDFLIRQVVGADPQTGAIAVNDKLRRGQTVQFHVRDAEAATEDLSLLLQKEVSDAGEREVVGGILFTCNGRGARLFETPHHDVTAVQRELTNVPITGFFASGELGPIGDRNFLHGFTASLALFCSPSPNIAQ